ncbi:hypothetical protein AVEN_14780-1 [Araneus ventricosus]|uniref:CRAL-TRIO domain-containing protein n=1 Tax=Araneus ventricosus TaxID=182803 RepID=A0A4Y2PM05_ARAVE|nr:hypothetical protein AVEN_14780-1 [Araneus ventricosus]
MSVIPDSLEFKDIEFDDDRLNGIKICQKEFPGRKTQSLNEFKSMLTGSDGLVPCLDDNFLLRFLRGAKHRPRTALKRLERYYYHRSLHPEIFQNYLPSNTLSAQELHHIKALPYRAKNLSPVLVIKLGLTDFQRVTFEELLRLDLLVFETLLQNPVTQLSGITIIIDFDGFSQAELVKLVTWLPTCYHVFHVVFYPANSDLEELHNQVDPDYLPEEYGGKSPSSSLVDLNPIVNEQERYFREQLQYGVIK